MPVFLGGVRVLNVETDDVNYDYLQAGYLTLSWINKLINFDFYILN